MKVPPKRKGNAITRAFDLAVLHGLNESPSEKEGKSCANGRARTAQRASMKVPPKRKGNVENITHNIIALVRLNESPSEKEGKLRTRQFRQACDLAPQ